MYSKVHDDTIAESAQMTELLPSHPYLPCLSESDPSPSKVWLAQALVTRRSEEAAYGSFTL